MLRPLLPKAVVSNPLPFYANVLQQRAGLSTSNDSQTRIANLGPRFTIFKLLIPQGKLTGGPERA